MLHSSRWRPTICKPTGSPVAENPAGTDIAGFAIMVTYQHDRIQSIYVVIAVPEISVGYAVFTSNGSDLCHGQNEVRVTLEERAA
jgi:hypothetical protein